MYLHMFQASSELNRDSDFIKKDLSNLDSWERKIKPYIHVVFPRIDRSQAHFPRNPFLLQNKYYISKQYQCNYHYSDCTINLLKLCWSAQTSGFTK